MTTLKSIALELLQKYEETQTSLIWEYSGDIDKSMENLDAEVAKYRDIIDKYAEQEQTGHWKRISMDRYTTHAQYWYECDKCGEHNLGNANFCPNCGARMVEPHESEESE